jgi:IclR family mhp operon transcriptional activator
MNNSKPIRAISRGLKVIEILNAHTSTSMCALSERTHMPRATLLRILRTLDDAGWLYRYRVSGEYRLTSKVCRLGEHLLTFDRLAETAAPVMDQLQKEFSCVSDIAIFSGQNMRILDSNHREPPRRRKFGAGCAMGSMSCSALGRAYLAFCSTSERQEILHRLELSEPTAGKAVPVGRRLELQFAKIRETGYALVEPGPCECRRNCESSQLSIAAPVRPNGQVRACLGVRWTKESSSTHKGTTELVPALLDAAQDIANGVWQAESA